MAEALARLWTKFLPEIEARLALIDQAAMALAAKGLPDEQRAAAHAAAHKLAGTLGTFGLQRGTELAREAEDFLAQERGTAEAQQLAGWAAELQRVIQSKR